ncbi:MAG: hypothetical protein KDK40_04295, partial [Chlamydiia bacterium]|nr:hypothetical protein [Chlamydiia bacterium]
MLTWEEVIALLRRHGQLLFLAAFFTSGIFFAIDARYPLTYSSSLILQVSNYTLGNSEQSNVQRLAQVLGGENQSVNNLAIDLTSQELLLPVIQELGLQVDVRPSGLIPWIQEMKELLYTNWRLLQGDSLYLPARADLPLEVREVTYRGEQVLSLVLTTQGTDGYLLREEDGTVLRGQWGAALSLSDRSTSFIIHWSDQPSQKLVSGQQYILTFVPSLYAWDGLQKSLKVTTSNGPNIY